MDRFRRLRLEGDRGLNGSRTASMSDRTASPHPDAIVRRLRRLRHVAWLMDAALRLPGTRFRLGLNSLIGLPPGVGDAALVLISLYFVFEAVRLHAPWRVLMRMVLNVAIEFALGVVPVLGDVLDVVWKANLRNVDILAAFYAALRRRLIQTRPGGGQIHATPDAVGTNPAGTGYSKTRESVSLVID